MTDIDTVIGLKLELEAKFKKLKEVNESLIKDIAELKSLITEKDFVISSLTGVNKVLSDVQEMKQIELGYIK